MVDVVEAVTASYANEPEPIEVALEPEKVESEQKEAESEQQEPDSEQVEAATEEKSKEELDPWPKPAKNAVARLKQSNARKNATIATLEQKLKHYESLQKEPAPSEDNYSTYDEFLDAKAERKFNIKIAESKLEDVKEQIQAYEVEEESARIAEVNEIGEAFEREHPAASKLIAENMPAIAALPPHVKRAIQAAENPPLALHNLIKDGKLEYLAHLPIEKAAMEIGKAEMRPMAPRPQTRAPEPMQPARANVRSGFNYESISPGDLLKAIR